ncbi:MAG: hypothetical protein GF383_10695 [Candidatus Lokiarchaeota archaeon]|nr:hypothetical protein [Candidatus Lokiarchaeota archaeon]MBD3341061.1 hypothetical protein [Candidatus Lokiarchaeota archaeon]
MEFIEKNNYYTISKLIRDSVKYFIEKQSALKGEELLRTPLSKPIHHSKLKLLTSSMKKRIVIILELTNVGEELISLYPDLRITQISLHRSAFKIDEKFKRSKYFGSTGPNFSYCPLNHRRKIG